MHETGLYLSSQFACVISREHARKFASFIESLVPIITNYVHMDYIIDGQIQITDHSGLIRVQGQAGEQRFPRSGIILF